MALNFLLKRSGTADKRPDPASMALGELDLNYDATTGGVYYKDSNGDVVKVGSAQVSATAPNAVPAGSSGNSNGEFWYDTSTSELKIWNGSAWEVTSSQEVAFYDSFGDLPATGLEDVLYVVKDTNTIYRAASSSSYDFTVGPTGDFPDLSTALADAAVVNGTTLGVQAGTYTLVSTLSINKQVKIYGEDKNTVILQSAATSSDPVTLVSVTTDNVVLKGLTINHRKTTNTSVETAVAVSGTGSPQTRVDGFILDDCIIRHVEFGLTIRGSNWKLSNSAFVYAGLNNSTRRHVGIYGVSGDCFAVDNTSDEDIVPGTTGNTRWYTLSATTGTNPNETYVGTLVIEGNTQAGGNLHQFFNQDAWQGSSGQYNLIVKNNTTTNESSAFVVLFGGAANFGDIIGEITVEGNSLSNVSGKGVVGLDASSLVAFRSSALTVHVPSPNTLANTGWASNWAEASGSSSNTVGYRTTTISTPTVAQDAVSPTIPPEPVTPVPTPSFTYALLTGVQGLTGTAPITVDNTDAANPVVGINALPQVTAPTASTDAGNEGQIASDATYFYMYTGGRWQRVAWDATAW
jgi:hypothetical protein